jgi:hypothetical protein
MHKPTIHASYYNFTMNIGRVIRVCTICSVFVYCFAASLYKETDG